MVSNEELATKVDVARWDMLRAHLERGGLIVVREDLDLTRAAVAVANDEADQVSGWIGSGSLAKPSAEQIAAWDAAPDRSFLMLIVSPYILIQEQKTQFQ